MIRTLTLLALMAAPAAAQQADMLKAAAVAIVSNQNCGRAVFDDVQVITFLFSGAVQRGLTKDQAVAETQAIVNSILSQITTRQKMQQFCAAMYTVQGQPL